MTVMPPVKAAWCCQHVCGFRYADDRPQLVPSGENRISQRPTNWEDDVFTIDDVRDALGDCLKGERPGAASEFTGVTNDSRVAKPGKLFVALTTPTGYAIEVRDGHDFIGDAMAHGASGVVLQRRDIPN